MAIKNYSDLNSLELDTLKEIGSIGTGNAATALSSLIGQHAGGAHHGVQRGH